jgi:hypothetical protein
MQEGGGLAGVLSCNFGFPLYGICAIVSGSPEGPQEAREAGSLEEPARHAKIVRKPLGSLISRKKEIWILLPSALDFPPLALDFPPLGFENPSWEFVFHMKHHPLIPGTRRGDLG